MRGGTQKIVWGPTGAWDFNEKAERREMGEYLDPFQLEQNTGVAQLKKKGERGKTSCPGVPEGMPMIRREGKKSQLKSAYAPICNWTLSWRTV